MRKPSFHLLLFTLCLIAPAAALADSRSGALHPGIERAGTLKEVRGTVHLHEGLGTVRPAHAGDALAATDRVETEANSGASVVLRDGSTIVIGPATKLELKAFHFDATTHEGGIVLSLIRGSLRMISGLISKSDPQAVRVETQTATIGIRGTDFIVEAGAVR